MTEVNVNADLHIHSALSPCAHEEMGPQKILQRAYEMGLNLIGIADHNSVLNLKSFVEAADTFKPGSIRIVPGIEIQCEEEVHILCLFETVSLAEDFYKYIENYLTDIKNKKSIFGEQLVLDSKGSIIGIEERLLLSSVRLNVERVAARVHEFEGLVIAAHIDRPAYSLLSLLGFIPKNLRLNALEVSARVNPQVYIERIDVAGYPVISSSDAHLLSDIGRAYISYKGELDFYSLKKALLNNKFRIMKGGD
ncbi:MAG: PHP domain-containing protein [Clostridia bacterium]|nr:PHP domain-containing protein [Clostridia bacterium]